MNPPPPPTAAASRFSLSRSRPNSKPLALKEDVRRDPASGDTGEDPSPGLRDRGSAGTQPGGEGERAGKRCASQGRPARPAGGWQGKAAAAGWRRRSECKGGGVGRRVRDL